MSRARHARRAIVRGARLGRHGGWLVALAIVLAVPCGCSSEEIVVAWRLPDAGNDSSFATADAASDAPGTDDGAREAAEASDADNTDALSEAGDDGAMGPGPRPPCRNADDCDLSEYCSKRNCDDFLGRCERRPTLCDATPGVYCGCDGINYFNNCLRKANGVASATPGECDTTAVHCDGQFPPCPGEGYCAKLFNNRLGCPLTSSGVCWVLPSVCGTDEPGGDRWTRCPGPPGPPGPPAPCIGTCEAIRSEQVFARTRCQQ